MKKFIMLHFLINQTYFLGQDNEKMQFSSNIFHFMRPVPKGGASGSTVFSSAIFPNVEL